jgi:hypothetical protein
MCITLLLHSCAKSRDQTCNFIRVVVQSLELFLVDITDIERKIQLRADFRASSFRYRKELVEFSAAPSFETFRQVEHD